MKTVSTLTPSVFALFISALALNAQVSFDGVTSYNQNFDTLNSTDNTTATFTDNSTLLGWYVNSEAMDGNSDLYEADIGNDNGGNVYSYGAPGIAERALGYVGSGGNDYFNAGLRLVNNSGSEITSLSISYIGEQWRSGGTTNDNNNFLNFSYQIFSSGAGSVPASTSVIGWTEVNALDFSAPQSSIASGALIGNDAANRTSLSSTISLSWSAGDELWLRWTGNDGTGSDAGLGIDNITVAVPEPGTYALIAGMLALASVMYRRRNA